MRESAAAATAWGSRVILFCCPAELRALADDNSLERFIGIMGSGGEWSVVEYMLKSEKERKGGRELTGSYIIQYNTNNKFA